MERRRCKLDDGGLPPETAMITAGKISGLFGAKGEVSLSLFDAFTHDFDTEEPVFVRIDAHTVPLFFERFSRRGTRGATALFADIDTEARAAELIGLEFSIRPVSDGIANAGVTDEIYFEDLIGWSVELDTGQSGRITDYFYSEHNPLLEIEISGKRVLIPAADEFIREIDERHRKIVFELPDGLLDLNN